MSMTMNVIAFRDMDGEFKRMLDAKLYCDAHGFSYPAEVESYFQGQAKESEKMLREEFLTVDIDLRKWRDDYREGYELDVSTLPSEVKTLRFYASW